MTYLFRIMILALFLSGCSAFEQKIGFFKQDQFCCEPDTEFPHSCDGYILFEKAINLEE